MFTFFHRTPKIIIDAFTSDAVTYNCTPIVRASKEFPEWWKNLPDPGLGNAIDNIMTNIEKTNMKRCYGLTQFYKRSFIVKNYADLHIRVTRNGYTYYTLGTCPTTHNKNQYEKAFENYIHMKIIMPWIFKEKTGIDFLLVGAEYNLDTYNFKVLPGIINFVIPEEANFQIMLPLSKEKEYYDVYLPIGLPVYHLFPLTEKKVELKCHLITDNEINKIAYKQIKTFKKYDTLIKMAKNNRCPFDGD